MTRIIGIMAVASNGVIGRNGDLPWNIPEEMEHFRRTTKGRPLLMGRKNFESMPAEALQNRPIYVFSHQPVVKDRVNYETFSSFAAFVERRPFLSDMYMIGGAEIAHLFMQNRALDGFILTRLHQPYEGDVKLDLNLWNDWQILKEEVYDTYTIHYLMPPFAKGNFHDFFVQPAQNT